MSGEGWAQVRRFASVPSTSKYVLEAAGRGAAAGLVAVADYQTAGRGRLGRRWEAPPGSCLLMSVLLRPVMPAERLYLCTAAMALAAGRACEKAAGVAPGVKWPNDLLVADRKLAGVLAEVDFGAPGGRAGSVAVVVGIGLNVDWPGPPEAGGTCLQEVAGRPVSREAVLDAVLEALGPLTGALDTEAGRAAIARELRRRCVTLGRWVRVSLPPGGPVAELVGRATALTDEGHLIVTSADGSHEVSAADVVHLRPVDVPKAGPDPG